MPRRPCAGGTRLRTALCSTSRRGRFYPLPRPVDVPFELADHETLVGDDGLADVADRRHANELVAVDDGHVPNVIGGHERHALVDRLVSRNADDLLSHDVA